MASADCNIVLGGAYEGYHVVHLNNNNVDYVYLKENKKSFSKETVKSIEVVNANAGDKSLNGAIWGGAVGAVVGSSLKDMLIRVTWKDGGESLIKVASGIYEHILAASYRNEKKAEEIAKAESNSTGAGIITVVVIGFIWLILYLIGSNG